MSKGNTWDYIKTGLKLFVVNLVMAIIFIPINMFFALLFGTSIIASITAGAFGFALVMAIILLVLFLAITLYVGGFLAQKFWRWD